MTAPRGVVKTSLGVERAHVGSAIELRYRRQIATAFFATQERFTFYHGSCVGVPIPMRKPPTGEPCAGELHARFGGRGRRKPFPTPIAGLYKKYGLDVDLVLIRSAATITAALIAGETPMIQLGGNGTIQAALQGADCVNVQTLVPIIPQSLVVTPDIKTSEDRK